MPLNTNVEFGRFVQQPPLTLKYGLARRYPKCDPMVGDETGGFPSGVPLRRKGSHPMKVFGWPERFLVAEMGEFRHTVLVTHHFGMI